MNLQQERESFLPDIYIPANTNQKFTPDLKKLNKNNKLIIDDPIKNNKKSPDEIIAGFFNFQDTKMASVTTTNQACELY
jgi:hypothetical protein